MSTPDSTVRYSGTGDIVDADGGKTPVNLTWAYDPADPLFVKVRFSCDDTPTWEISRDLLDAALRDYTAHGELDVILGRNWPDTLIIKLSSPDGDACVETIDRAPKQLMRRAQQLVPAGQEDLEAAIDDAISRCLSSQRQGGQS